MQRTSVTAINPKTKQASVFEGVLLDSLLPEAQTRYKFVVYKPAWAFRDIPVLASESVHHTKQIVVADTMDGRPIRGDNPFILVAEGAQGQDILAKNIAYIKFSELP